MKNNMKYFVSYKDGPSFEVIIEDERKMVSHSFYDKSFGWECSWKCSVIGIIWEEKQNEKRK